MKTDETLSVSARGGKMRNIKNISFLKYGLIAVVLCFIISLFVYMQFYIDEPVFLKHYYDMEINYSANMNIYFITNSFNTRKISEINFPQMPDGFAFINIINIGNGLYPGYYWTEKFAHYNYHNFNFEIRAINFNENDIKEESVVLDKAVIIYSNGEKQEVNIGKIVLHKNSKHSESLTSTFVKSSNDNTSTSVFISNDNFVINSISSNLDEEVKDILKLSLDGKDTNQLNYPIHITPDDSLTFDSQFKFDSQDMRRYNVYDIQKKISLIDSEGNQESTRILNLDYQPAEIFLKEKDIIQYLKEIGVK